MVLSLEAYKAELRRAHLIERARCYEEALEQALRFFALYERVNRDFCPEDPVYSVTRSGGATVAGNDLWTWSAVASRQYRLLELILGSEATASAAKRVGYGISSGGTTGGGGATPEKFNVNSPTSMFTSSNLFTTWSAQPTFPAASRAAALVFGFNELGGFVDWKAAPGAEVYWLNEQVSLRNLAGSGALSATAIWEEL